MYKNHPEFVKIHSLKAKFKLFTEVCPILTERHRERKQKLLEDSWTLYFSFMDSLFKKTFVPNSWIEVSRLIKKEPWFKILNQKEMEKIFRERLADHIKHSTVYKPIGSVINKH